MMTRRHMLAAGALASAAGALPRFAPTTAAQTAAAPPEFFKLPALPYAVDALEPHIDAQTMTIHHTKHHQAYINNLNAALAKLPAKPKGTDEELHGWLSNLDSVPEDIRTTVRNNGGGHYNHALFWESLGAKKTSPTGALRTALEKKFKSEEDAIAQYLDKGAKVFGSGWVWLVYDPKEKDIALTSTPNQDTPLASGHIPLLGIDVWEHAYYLKYQNKRADYLKAITNVIAWDVIEARYEKALKA